MLTCFVIVHIGLASETFTFTGQDARREAYEFWSEADDGFDYPDEPLVARWWCEKPTGKTGWNLKRERAQ